MRLGRGSQFPGILGPRRAAGAGASCAAWGGTQGVSTAVWPADAVGVFPGIVANATSLHFCALSSDEGRELSPRSAPATAPAADTSSLRAGRPESPLPSHDISTAACVAYAKERYRRAQRIALNERREPWIAKKAPTALPANKIPCHDETWMSRLAGLSVYEISLAHSALARGPPQSPRANHFAI